MYSFLAEQSKIIFWAVHRIFTNAVFHLRKCKICSLLFGAVRCVFVLEKAWKLRRCAESCTCSFCSLKKKRYPLPFENHPPKMWSEKFLNVVKFYTLADLLPIIYVEGLIESIPNWGGVLFFFSSKNELRKGVANE